jgi:hypothetical protein
MGYYGTRGQVGVLLLLLLLCPLVDLCARALSVACTGHLTTPADVPTVAVLAVG